MYLSHIQCSALKQYDIYATVQDEYKVKTSSGATCEFERDAQQTPHHSCEVSIVGWVVVAILLLVETRVYFTAITREHLTVDDARNEQLRININITFHALTCAQVHMDSMDVAGDNQLNVEHDMYKLRLTSKGVPIGKPGTEVGLRWLTKELALGNATDHRRD
jgi:hypothetical protein